MEHIGMVVDILSLCQQISELVRKYGLDKSPFAVFRDQFELFQEFVEC